MYRIAYFHGLLSQPTEGRLSILGQYSEELYAPTITYLDNPNVFEELLEACQKQHINFIVGSSAGGLMGFHIAKHIGCKTLLFNPALPYLSVEQRIREAHAPKDYFNQILLGSQDQTIRPTDTLDYLQKNETTSRYSTEIIDDLGHRIPPEIFEYACQKYICR
jgi:uncharacterized protein